MRQRAFTLIELLVVVAIIGLLTAILVPSLSHARLCALRARSASNLRQMLLGYTMYHTESNGHVLFGYTPPTINGMPVSVTSGSGQVFGLPVADRYPWRLAPYVSNMWVLLHDFGQVPESPLASDTPSEALQKAYKLSLSPAYGINSAYVGGDKNFAGFIGDKPNYGAHAVFRAGSVRRASELIVFAESCAKNMGPTASTTAGMHYLLAPNTGGQRWKVTDGQIETVSNVVMGVPQSRYGNRTVTAFFDGHVEQMKVSELADMRLWYNAAETPTSDYVP